MKMFDAGKTRMIGLPYGEKNYDDMLSRFHLIPERHGQTDGQTDRFAISISRVRRAIKTTYTYCGKTTYRSIVLLKLTTDRHEASRGLFATAQLLVDNDC